MLPVDVEHEELLGQLRLLLVLRHLEKLLRPSRHDLQQSTFSFSKK